MAHSWTSVDVVTADGVAISHRFGFHDPPSEKLLVILPGRVYLAEHPVPYYLRQAALGLGYDVLSMQFGFQVSASANLSMEGLAAECRLALEPVLGRGYQKVCLAGKSLGTPLAVQLAGEMGDAEVSLLLLTPIGTAVRDCGERRTLAVIGTADRFYSSEAVAADAGRVNVAWEVFEGLNHSLEVPGDWETNVRVLGEVIVACEAFLQE